MKRYIITGATSFIGKELIRCLQSASDNEVYAICRQKTQMEDTPCARSIEADMSEYGELHKQIDHADVFINLAWKGTGHSGRDLQDIQQENIRNTMSAIQSAHKMGCRLFVEAGSQAEYGTVLSTITEETPCNPFSEYGKAKLEVKEQAFELCKQLGMKYIHLRIFSIYGEEDHPWTLVMSSIDKMMKNENMALSPCTQHWNFLYVKDAANQITRLCEHAFHNEGFQQEIYNIASEDTRILRNFIERMKYLTKSKSILDYGAIKLNNVVSLQPDITKLKRTIGYREIYSFDDVISSIIKTRVN